MGIIGTRAAICLFLLKRCVGYGLEKEPSGMIDDRTQRFSSAEGKLLHSFPVVIFGRKNLKQHQLLVSADARQDSGVFGAGVTQRRPHTGHAELVAFAFDSAVPSFSVPFC